MRKYVLVAVILVVLGIGIWALSLSPAPNTPQSENPVQHNDPQWAFPLEDEPTIPLPDFRPVVVDVIPSVVCVTAEVVSSDFFGHQYTESVAGSGILIDDKGYIATNSHVVEDAENIYVELADERTFPADIVGSDSLSDLAVIKIDATDLPYASWGDSSSLSLGEWVLAIGNALGGGEMMVSAGVVSRLYVSVNVEGNVLYGLIQTDAAINPGNSGGPLVNMAGEIIGITSVKIVATDVEGIGYAISSSEAKPIIEELIHYGRVVYPWLGVAVSTVTPLIAASQSLSVDSGAIIEELVDNSPAQAAGLRVDDIIIGFGGEKVQDIADLIKAIRSSEVGEDVEIVFVRGEDTKTTSARLVERPTP